MLADLPLVETTSYCQHGQMADGSYTRRRSAASNTLKFGTKIRLVGTAGPGGLRLYVIRDRIGYGTQLDLWTDSCVTAKQFGRKKLRYKLGWKK